MSIDNTQTNGSRRKFIKVAAASAYIAPLIASMPAHATFTSNGSKPVKKVWKKPVWRRKTIYRTRSRFSQYRRYSRYTRRW